MKRLNLEDFLKLEDKKNIKFIDLDRHNLSSSGKIFAKCNKCDYIWETLYNRLNCRKHVCLKCICRFQLTLEDFHKQEDIKNIKFIGLERHSLYSIEKIKVKCCKCEYIWETNYRRTNSHSCPKCAGKLKLTIDDYLKLENEKNVKFDLTMTNFRKCNKVKTTCNECNYKWETTYEKVKKAKIGCIKCAGKVRLDIQDFLKLESLKNVKFLDLYNHQLSNRKMLQTKCKKCDYIWATSYNRLKDLGTNCPNCVRFKPPDLQDFLQLEIDRDIKFVNLACHNLTSNEEIEIICNKCDRRYVTTYSKMKYRKYGCVRCCGSASPELSDFLSLEKLKNIQFINLKDQELFSIKKIKAKCNKCNCIWETTYNRLSSQNSGCPTCAAGRGETITKNIFKLLFNSNFNKIRPKWLINPNTNYSLELDGYSPELNMAFEYNGSQHYKEVVFSSESLEAIQKRDIIKKQICKDLGIDFVVIKQYSSLTKKGIFAELQMSLKRFNFDKQFLFNIIEIVLKNEAHY
jgi:hypothetical protein